MMLLDEKLKAYGGSDVYPFHMPGHKRQEMGMERIYSMDITEIEGFDDLHDAQDILKKAQERAAKLYDAKKAYYLVNGSTCGILAAVSASVNRRGKILVARNSHKSLYHALFLMELDPVYLYPTITKQGIQGQITPEMVASKLEENPEVEAVFITSPTYDGVVSDIKEIANIVHQYNIPLIVDEAHGAHFGMNSYFPENATRLGADIVITSLHKTMPALTQTALLLVCSKRVPMERIEKFLHIYQTSSPSYLLMASMEKCVEYVRQEGDKVWEQYASRLEQFYAKAKALKHIHVLNKECMYEKDCFDFDREKILMFPEKIDGKTLHRMLLDDYHLEMEMVTDTYVLAMTSIMDTNQGFERLTQALQEIDAKLEDINEVGKGEGELSTDKKWMNRVEVDKIYKENKIRVKLADVEGLEVRKCPMQEAVGEVCAEFIFLYPPGIPILVPGEEISQTKVTQLMLCIEKNLNIKGVSENGINVVNLPGLYYT